MKTILEAHSYLKTILSPARYYHSFCVAELAEELAERYGWDKKKAYEAGLFHDCAKEWSPKKLQSYAQKHRLRIPHLKFILNESPNLLHAYVGAHWAKKMKWIRSNDQVQAIRSHTLADVHMSVPQKILYVADYVSSDRRFPSAQRIRAVAKKNIEDGFRAALAGKISYSFLHGKSVHPTSIQAWNTFIQKNKKKK